MKQPIAEYLEACRFFARVDEPGRARLRDIAVLQHFPKGTTIFRQDEPCPGVYIVGTGLVRIFKIGASGKEHVLHLSGPGQTFAEVASIGGFNCPAWAEAVEHSDCLLLPRDAFTEALRKDPNLAMQILTGMAQWVRQLVGLMEDIVLRDATSRVASYLVQSTNEGEQELTLPTLKKHLASHLNLTSETLSRSLRRLEEAGFSEKTGGGRGRIADSDGLREVAVGNFPRL
jgi:CRP/FNR family transcriptional regulator